MLYFRLLKMENNCNSKTKFWKTDLSKHYMNLSERQFQPIDIRYYQEIDETNQVSMRLSFIFY